MTALWTPPSGLDMELQPAGRAWDAVKSPAYLGDVVLARLGETSGAVIRDPWSHALYWLVRTGAADGWRLPHVTVLGAACYVVMPPAHRTRSLGPHWAVPPVRGRELTDPALLHQALSGEIAAAFGPRQGAVS